MSYTEKFKEYVKNNVVDSTAMLAVATPVFAGLETLVLGMSNEVSSHARLLTAGLGYVGFGYAITKGRDVYRKAVNVNDKSKKRTQLIHDTVYGALFNLVIGPPFYLLAGARDLTEIIGGTLIGMGYGLVSGSLMGYSIDTYRDLTGIKESQRLPSFIKKKSSKFKLGVAAMITAASIALTSGIYAIVPEKKQAVQAKQKIACEIDVNHIRGQNELNFNYEKPAH